MGKNFWNDSLYSFLFLNFNYVMLFLNFNKYIFFDYKIWIYNKQQRKAVMTQGSTVFISSTLMGRDQNKKVSQLLQSLLDSSDSFEFRSPVDWKAYGLLDYPVIIKKPMDLGTIKKNLSNNIYQTVEDCLRDIELVWTNCKTYNKQNTYYQKLSDKLDKMTKKMIKNYLPFVFFQTTAQKKKAPVPPKKQVANKKNVKSSQPQQPKTYEDRKQNQIQQQAKQQDSPFIRMRKQFLIYIPLCTPEQIGVIFMLIHKNEPQAIQYSDEGEAKVIAQKLTDKMVTRLVDQMDMWGIGYVSTKKK